MTAPNQAQLHDLYRHLEHYANGDRYLAYYGQLRAQEYPHSEAVRMTVEYFRLGNQDWYRARFEEKP